MYEAKVKDDEIALTSMMRMCLFITARGLH